MVSLTSSFCSKNEDEHSNLKEKVDNLTPGLKILFKNK